jgi:lipid-binding SYLF domain-containing protein
MSMDLYMPSFADELVKIAEEEERQAASKSRTKQMVKNVAVIAPALLAGGLLGGILGHGVMRKWPQAQKYTPYAISALATAGALGSAALWRKASSLYDDAESKS